MADLGRELVTSVYEAFSAVPPAERRLSHWVMNPEWRNELRKVTDGQGLPLWPASDLLLGLPCVIADDGGVPHLEPDAVPRGAPDGAMSPTVTTAQDGPTDHGHAQ